MADFGRILRAATIFYIFAQDTGPMDQLIGLSNKLANPTPVPNPDKTIDSSLISTLQQEVDQMETQDRFPITRAESKSAVRNLYNAVKQFHSNLVRDTGGVVLTTDENRTRMNGLNNDFQNVINQWDQYKRSYLSNDFLNELQLAKSEANPEQQQEFEKRYQFWKELIDQVDGTIGQIDKLLKDQLTGNPETPLEPTPV
jgi:hypothetical protein